MQKLRDIEHHLQPSPRMPVLFVGHGNPMNAILDNDISRTWQTVGAALPKPQAFVVISAHWLTYGTHITDAPRQPIIYDMYGFPPGLYQVEYPAPGDPRLAELLRHQFLQYEAQLDSTWGLDHGTWSVLRHMAPSATTPVLQISLDMRQALPDVVRQFALLRSLRRKGVIFIGSGNIVHNLRALNFMDATTFDWALEFDARAAAAMSAHDIDRLVRPKKFGSSAQLAVAMDDHYRPMLAAMALLDDHEELHYFNDVIEMGSIGMRSFIAN